MKAINKRRWLKYSWMLGCLLILIVAWIIFFHKHILVYDGFEVPALGKQWTSSRMEKESFTIQSAIVRNGRNALQITLHTGDKPEEKTAQDKASERDELSESYSEYALEGKTYDYKFSLFLPDSFPIVPTRLVLAQWKQFCPFCSCSSNSPLVALRYISGKLFITLQTSSRRDTVFLSDQEFRNSWHDFNFRIRFSKDNDGLLIVKMDNKEIINYKGVSSYADNCRVLSNRNKYYFKMGLYRDQMPKPMTIFIDEYSKIQLNE
jgi:hypothetical protein